MKKWSTAPDSCIPLRVCTSVVMLGREASESVPPPVAAPQPVEGRGRVQPALDGPRCSDQCCACARDRQAACRRSDGPCRREGSLAQKRPERPVPASAAVAASAALAAASATVAKLSEASASAICCEANCSMSWAAWRSTSAALCPTRSNKGSTSEGLPRS